MPTRRRSTVVEHLRGAALLPDGAGLTDGQLLDCYVRRREEAAFAALVRRHGPMVWGVCARALGAHHDAEDAFQATFLVLARKAAGVVPREAVANWLYGVARRTALKARAVAARRRARERQVQEMPQPEAAEPGPGRDLLALLDGELSRLPDKYRLAVVLCDLEGKTYKEAARQLGCPEGTLSARLARARARLAKRLARHSLGLTGAALAAILAQGAAAAPMPPSLITSTVQAVASSAGAGAVSAKVVALTEGVCKAMLLAKLKVVTAVLLAVGALGGAAVAGFLTAAPASGGGREKRADDKPEKPKAEPEKGKKKADRTEKVTLQYRIKWDAVAPSRFVAVIDGGITLALKIEWDIPAADKKKLDAVVADLEKREINGVEFECKGEWRKKGLDLRVTTLPTITEAGKKRIKDLE